jgi:hypothetical protein
MFNKTTKRKALKLTSSSKSTQQAVCVQEDDHNTRTPTSPIWIPIWSPIPRLLSKSGTFDFQTTKSIYAAQTQPRFASLESLSPFIREVDPDHASTKTFRAWFSQRDVVLIAACVIAAVVFLINFIGSIVLTEKYHTGLLYKGDCMKVSNMSARIHILINILSSLLLGASNLGMQLLAAPTREEVDKAHKKSVWLDIGVPSFRNTLHIAWSRRWTWWFLGISSIPLHFLSVKHPIFLEIVMHPFL